jgi:NNP family nitrate/nitrite transporter-like MFS transporter
VIFQRKHNWIMCWLYTGTFGSFIGYSAAFPLLAKTQFPDVNACNTPSSGRWSARCRARDRLGRRPLGRRARHLLGVRRHDDRRAGVLYFLGRRISPLHRVLRQLPVLFFATGVGNASTFQMIPAIMRKECRADARTAMRR